MEQPSSPHHADSKQHLAYTPSRTTPPKTGVLRHSPVSRNNAAPSTASVASTASRTRRVCRSACCECNENHLKYLCTFTLSLLGLLWALGVMATTTADRTEFGVAVALAGVILGTYFPTPFL